MSMADELKSAQEGKNLLASMVVDLETQLEGAKAEKAEAYVDNASLANEVHSTPPLRSPFTAAERRRSECRPLPDRGIS